MVSGLRIVATAFMAITMPGGLTPNLPHYPAPAAKNMIIPSGISTPDRDMPGGDRRRNRKPKPQPQNGGQGAPDPKIPALS